MARRPPDAAEIRQIVTKAPNAAVALVILILEKVGRSILEALDAFGKYVTLTAQAIAWSLRPPFRLRLIFKQMEFVGVKSLSIIVLSGIFTGMVFAWQSADVFGDFKAEGLVGPTVVLALTVELSPVLTALMIAGRAGSAMSAEIGTMKVTEQVDALLAMAVNPVNYLVVPRVIASVLMLPVMCMVFNIVGTFGAWLVVVRFLGHDEGVFVKNVEWFVDADDLYKGMLKAGVFGFIIATVGCYKGYYTSGGAEGVGRATTQSVVISSVTVLISDYFLSMLLTNGPVASLLERIAMWVANNFAPGGLP